MLPIVAVARSMARFGEGDYAGALETADLAIVIAPELQSARRLRVASLEMLGDHAAASAAVERPLALGPVNMAWIQKELIPFGQPEPWATYLDALRDAGVPE